MSLNHDTDHARGSESHAYQLNFHLMRKKRVHRNQPRASSPFRDNRVREQINPEAHNSERKTARAAACMQWQKKKIQLCTQTDTPWTQTKRQTNRQTGSLRQEVKEKRKRPVKRRQANELETVSVHSARQIHQQ